MCPQNPHYCRNLEWKEDATASGGSASLSTNFLYPLNNETNMAYCQLQKVEADMHIKASAEQFYDVLCNRTHHVANIFPGKIQSVEIHKVNGALRDLSSLGIIYMVSELQL
ncbi:hypothetical protein JHK84_044046 [Glycine max]|nr:hypothetical protein JHK84_044046 [Glycine max]